MKMLKTELEYKEATAKGNVIVVFGSSQKCPACEQLAVHITAFKKQHKAYAIYKAHVQDFAEEVKKFSIRSVPVMVFYKDGSPCNVQPGVRKSDEIAVMAAQFFDQK